MLVDTHAHLQFPDYEGKLSQIIERAITAGVGKIITIGTDAADSTVGVELAAQYENVSATVGLHPHDAKQGLAELPAIRELVGKPGVVAVGECGLDYYHDHAPAAEQEAMLRAQIELALEADLPIVFHVRDAFADFWRVLADYPAARGVVHSFTGRQADLDQALERGLNIALNGIVTFTKDPTQLEVFKAVPLESLVLETDCPFLSPVPNRGKTNTPGAVKDIAKFLANLRGESLEQLEAATTANAERLFAI